MEPVVLSFRVTDEGTLEVFDQGAEKLTKLGTAAQDTDGHLGEMAHTAEQSLGDALTKLVKTSLEVASGVAAVRAGVSLGTAALKKYGDVAAETASSGLASVRTASVAAAEAAAPFGVAIGVVAAGAVVATYALRQVSQGLDEIDAAAKRATKIELPTDDLLAMSRAASVAGISQETLESAVTSLNGKLREGLDPESQTRDILDALGISVNGGTTPAVMRLADVVSNLQDPLLKMKLATALAISPEFLALLEKGSSNLVQFQDQTGATRDVLKGAQQATAEYRAELAAIDAQFEQVRQAAAGPVDEALAQLHKQLVDLRGDFLLSTPSFLQTETNGATLFGEALAAPINGLREMLGLVEFFGKTIWGVQELPPLPTPGGQTTLSGAPISAAPPPGDPNAALAAALNGKEDDPSRTRAALEAQRQLTSALVTLDSTRLQLAEKLGAPATALVDLEHSLTASKLAGIAADEKILNDAKESAKTDADRAIIQTKLHALGVQSRAVELEQRLAILGIIDEQFSRELAFRDADTIRATTATERGRFALDLAERQGASFTAQLDLARQIDAAQVDQYKTEIDAYQVELVRIEATQGLTEEMARQTGEGSKITAQQERLNTLIAQGGEAVRKVNDQYRVTIDLNNTMQGVASSAATSLLHGGSLTASLSGITTGIEDAFVQGFIKAQVAKLHFDDNINANFGTDLPKIFQAGADALTTIWGKAFGTLSDNADSAFSSVSDSAHSSATSVAGAFRNSPDGSGHSVTSSAGDWAMKRAYGAVFGGGGTADSIAGVRTTGTDASGRTTLTNDFGQQFSAPSGQVGQAADAAAGVGGGSSGMSTGSEVGAGAMGGLSALTEKGKNGRVGSASGLLGAAAAGAAAGPWGAVIAAAAYIAISGLMTSINRPDLGRRQGFDLGGIAITNILGLSKTESQDFSAVLTGGLSLLVNESLKAAGLFQAPTMEDQFGLGGDKLFKKAGVARAVTFQNTIYDRPLADLQAAATKSGTGPEVGRVLTGSTAPETWRKDAAGVGNILYGDGQQGAMFGNEVVNSARALGETANQTKDDLLALAAAAGLTLTNGLERARTLFLETHLTQVDYNASVSGLVDLFTADLPPGVQASTIALHDMTDAIDQYGHHVQVLNVEQFNKDLSAQVQIFSALQSAVEGGVTQGGIAYLNAIHQATPSPSAQYITTQGGAVIPATATVTAIEVAQQAKDALRLSIEKSISDGVTAAISADLTNAIKNSPLGIQLETDIAAGVNAAVAGNSTAAHDAFSAAILDSNGIQTNMLGALDTIAQITANIQTAVELTPTSLRAEARTIQDEIDTTTFGMLTAHQQKGVEQSQLAGAQTQADKDKALLASGTLSPADAQTTAADLKAMYEKEQKIAEWYIGLGDKKDTKIGLGILESLPAGFNSLADSQAAAQDALTTATTANTAATNANTAAQGGTPVATGTQPATSTRPVAPVSQAPRFSPALAVPSSPATSGTDSPALLKAMERIVALATHSRVNVSATVNTDGAVDEKKLVEQMQRTMVPALLAAMRDPRVVQEMRRVVH